VSTHESTRAPPGAARAPGWAAAIFDAEEIREAWTSGLADLARSVAVTRETRFRWYSVTKLVTAALVVRLVEEGRLELDDPIRKHLPWARLSPTVRELLSHSAGLHAPSALGWVHPRGAARRTPRELTEALVAGHRSLRSNVRVSRYTNLGYLLLGELVEALSEAPFRTVAEERVLAPLGLSRTSLDPGDASVGHEPLVSLRAAVMSAMFFPRSMKLVRYVRSGWIGLAPFELEGEAYGGLVGSLDDLVRLGAMFLREGRGVLSAPSARAMMRPASPDGRFGLGFWILDDGWVGHAGEAGGFRSELRLHRERGVGVAVLANSGVATVERVSDALVRGLG
jgi:CubicO group peptidase (beta-lactamase class C family)